MTEKDIELGLLDANTTLAQGPQHYFQEFYELGALLNNTANMVQKLKEASKEFNSVTESAAMEEIKGRMEEDMDELGKMAHDITEKIGEMIQKNVENRKKPGCGKGTAMDISRMSLTISLKARLNERKSDLQNLGKTIQQEYLEVIQRRTFTVTGVKLSDEVIRVIDIGSVVQMFENALQGISTEQTVAAVDEIKERHTAATDFGKKILEVQQTFERMAALVERMAAPVDEKLRYERAENNLVFLVVGWFLLMLMILVLILALTSG